MTIKKQGTKVIIGTPTVSLEDVFKASIAQFSPEEQAKILEKLKQMKEKEDEKAAKRKNKKG